MKFPFMKLFPLWLLPPRFRYQDPAFLKALDAAVQLLYRLESPVRTRLVPLPVVHMMLTQHSLFLPTLLTSEGEDAPCGPVKGDLPQPPVQGSPWCLTLGAAVRGSSAPPGGRAEGAAPRAERFVSAESQLAEVLCWRARRQCRPLLKARSRSGELCSWSYDRAVGTC